MRSVNKIDYAGFTFAGIHSSQYGLYSVSNGDRYNRYLSPTIKNLTAENTGGNGTYFFGSQYTQQSFQFSMAFDSVTEDELRKIKSWLANDISPLILDENPYIEYYAKVSTAPQINFLVFDDNAADLSETIDDIYTPSIEGASLGRLYKGEMTISFISYDSFGYSVYKWLDDYDDLNKNEWALSSGLLKNNLKDYVPYYDIYNNLGGYDGIPLYNAGDRECDFILTIDLDNSAYDIEVKIDEAINKRFELKIPTGTETDLRQLKIDTRKRLISINGIVANECIIAGDFFKIPLGESILALPSGLSNVNISYRYIYM